MLARIPNSLDQIIHIFGSIDDPAFEADNIVFFELPYPLIYDGAPLHRARCHRLAVDHFTAAFGKIKSLIQQGSARENDCNEYGGIYCRRAIRGTSHPSTHSWGIAIDLEPLRYPLGSADRFPDAIVNAFKSCGFFYGGDFLSRRDPMHFQLCTGY